MKYILSSRTKNKKVTDKVLIEDLQKAAKKIHSDSLSIRKYHKHGNYSDCTIGARFGSWNGALIKAGLKPIFSKINDEELFKNIKDMWHKLGRQPSNKEMRSTLSRYSLTTYKRRFGSLSNALKAFAKAYRNGVYDRKAVPVRILKGKNNNIKDGMRLKVFIRDKFRCKYCGASPADDPKVKLHVDHIKPLSKGGLSTIQNLQTLCSRCNLGKSVKVIDII